MPKKVNNPNAILNSEGPHVAAGLYKLVTNAMDHYEKHTGLTGIKDVVIPLFGQTIVEHVGTSTLTDLLGPELVGLGRVIFNKIISEQDKVRQIQEQQVRQAQVSNQTEQPQPQNGRPYGINDIANNNGKR